MDRVGQAKHLRHAGSGGTGEDLAAGETVPGLDRIHQRQGKDQVADGAGAESHAGAHEPRQVRHLRSAKWKADRRRTP